MRVSCIFVAYFVVTFANDVDDIVVTTAAAVVATTEAVVVDYCYFHVVFGYSGILMLFLNKEFNIRVAA